MIYAGFPADRFCSEIQDISRSGSTFPESSRREFQCPAGFSASEKETERGKELHLFQDFLFPVCKNNINGKSHENSVNGIAGRKDHSFQFRSELPADKAAEPVPEGDGIAGIPGYNGIFCQVPDHFFPLIECPQDLGGNRAEKNNEYRRKYKKHYRKKDLNRGLVC